MNDLSREIDGFVQRYMPHILADLRRLVKIPSISQTEIDAAAFPYGKECARALDLALEIAKEKGLQPQNHNYFYGTATYGSGEHTIGIFSHLDVVDAGSGWIYPPFDCTEKDGFVIGRGVGDDKLAALIGIYTALAMREIGIAPHIRLLVYFGCCEEKGMLDMDHYTAEQALPDFSLVPDIKFPVCIGERGWVRFALEAPSLLTGGILIHGGNPSAKIADQAQATLPCCSPQAAQKLQAAAKSHPLVSLDWEGGSLVVTARGQPPAAGDPRTGLNANHVLFSYLADTDAFPSEDMVLLRQCAQMMCPPSGSGFGANYHDHMSGDTLCNCIHAQTVDSRLRLQFDMRCPVTACTDRIMDEVKRTAAENSWTLLSISGRNGWYFPQDDPRVTLLCDAWEAVSGLRGQPYINSGGTYASRLKNAVGFGPMDTTRCPFLPAGHGSIHAPDEARSIVTIQNAFRTYLRAVDALDRYYIANRD